MLLISRRKEATDAYQGKSYEFPTEASGSAGGKTQMAKLSDVLKLGNSWSPNQLQRA